LLFDSFYAITSNGVLSLQFPARERQVDEVHATSCQITTPKAPRSRQSRRKPLKPATPDADDDMPRLYCRDLFSYSKSSETWIHCTVCAQWAHTACSRTSKTAGSFVYDICRS
jgi:hypothetical protein